MAKEVIMPALEMAQDTGVLVRWLKEEGEFVNQGEPLMEIETDKAVVEIEATAAGTLSNVSAQPGDEVPVGDVIAVLLTDPKEAPPTGPTPSPSETIQQSIPTNLAATPPSQEKLERAESRPDQLGRTLASPKARRLARELGVDLSTVTGSGPEGAVLAADLPRLAASQPEMVIGTEYSTVPIKGMRKVIAERMQLSYTTAPHISLSLSIDMAEIQQMRQRLNQAAEKLSTPTLKMTPLLCKAIALSLLKFPRLNAHLIDQEIREFKGVDLGVAVALEEGLVVPVLRGVELKGLLEIQSELSDLANRARQRQLKPEEMKNSTFTLSNLGMYEIEEFTSILNPPEVGILSAGSVQETPMGIEGQIVLRPTMKVTLGADHRAVDGAMAAQFLRYLKELLENPFALVLESVNH